MHPRARRAPLRAGIFPFAAALLLGASPLLGGCAPAKDASELSVDSLPKYEGREPLLFPDVIEPSAVGLSAEKLALKSDALYRQRVQRADGVSRMRVVTVTTENRGGANSYRLQFAVVEQKLGGTDRATRIDVDVKPGTNAYGVVRKLGDGLTNKVFLLSWKRYQVAGEAVVHYYAAPDDEDSRNATREALVLQEVKGQ
jgi:hypothetical protein